MKRVVITGIGAVTPLGNSIEATWRSALEGKTGIGPLLKFDSSNFTAKTAAEVKDFRMEDYMLVNKRHRMDRFAQYAVAASIMAVRDSGVIAGKHAEPERIGVYFGTAAGGLESFEETYKCMNQNGIQGVYPFAATMVISNMAASQVSIAIGARGYNNTSVLSCASSSNAIGEAFRVIQRGEADIMISGGSEASITPMGIGAFCAMGAISSNPDPATSCRPFDKDRDGLVMGEGSGVLVLETLESALKREAKIYGEIAGYSTVSDAYHITSPSPGGEGCVRAMELALAGSGLHKKDIDYINAHGTSTHYNDITETQAIKTFFQEFAPKIPISSTKSMTGHMMGAAGAIEAIFTLLTIENSIILPTIHLVTPDPECDLDYVPVAARKAPVKAALSNALGFGGHNTALIFKAY
ncbi:beta-ketoacyl-ACP synthase II [Bacillus sp. MUM 13]|uniref:beta-ketoacyl-ACP synthase II n=1 Tax=Bacillus sp. MUM 13 TaxID=1678001 RepID=UPI0008F58EAA|nr:beta-ketoacyl-ACP synthase II [Bacillus sp. MUM 13]OIK12713.1 beta-ketoacyl-[acyl-carrier-protein] synthase II [Bacillus sp. MUM 13]